MKTPNCDYFSTLILKMSKPADETIAAHEHQCGAPKWRLQFSDELMSKFNGTSKRYPVTRFVQEIDLEQRCALRQEQKRWRSETEISMMQMHSCKICALIGTGSDINIISNVFYNSLLDSH